MEIKKSPNADLQNKRSIFLLAGFIAAIGLMIAFLSISQSEKSRIIVVDATEVIPIEVIISTTDKDVAKPPVPKIVVSTEFLNIVKGDVEVPTEIFFGEFDDDLPPIVLSGNTNIEEPIESDIPLVIVSEMPLFNGKGIDAFREWCLAALKYPESAIENGIEGKVTLSFVVEKDGSISSVKVIRGKDPLLDKEALRVVASSPKWTPGKHQGVPARVVFNMPIEYKLR